MSLTDLLELCATLAAGGAGLRFASCIFRSLASWKDAATTCTTGGIAGTWLCTIALSDAARVATIVVLSMLILLVVLGSSDDGY